MQLGTYQVALVAKALKRPFYVAVESYKFARMYPLAQRDVSNICLSATYDCNEILQRAQSPNSPSAMFTDADKEKEKAESISSKNRNRSRSASMTSIGSQQCNSKFEHLNLTIDFTPAEYITLLFTDLGVLTPAAVSDELIRLYQ
jgi:translation initiation factor eIF-2B subunit alpha